MISRQLLRMEGLDVDKTSQKIEYLRELRAFITCEALTAAGKGNFLERATETCLSIQEDLGIKSESQPKG